MAFMFYCVERCTGYEEGLAQAPTKSAGQERDDSTSASLKPSTVKTDPHSGGSFDASLWNASRVLALETLAG